LCVQAEDFCFGEDVSGSLFQEIDLTVEWTIWGVIAGVVLIAIIVICAMWKKIDEKIHFCCGINQVRAAGWRARRVRRVRVS
jgi:hypothetical protein